MYIKTVYVIIDLLAALTLVFTIRAASKINKTYCKWLNRALVSAVVAILANILIAVSTGPVFAGFSYCLYFASIDWILYFLSGFCMLYTEHDKIHRRFKYPVAAILLVDSALMFSNLYFGHMFSVYRRIYIFGSFFQTSFLPPYYVHLALDYILVLIALYSIIIRIRNTYSVYRSKYVIILSVLVFVILLNTLYMALSLVLDASVIFYAVAGILIYFGITLFVPNSLKVVSVDRAVNDMKEGLVIIDITDRCIHANDFSRLRFGIEPEEWDLTCEPAATVIKELHENGKPFGSVVYTRPASEGPYDQEFYSIRYNELTDSKKRPIGSYFLIEDTTETEYLLRQVKEAKTAADSANKAKSDFLASMSHEIRTPLNSVLGMNEMIMRTTDDPQLVEYAQNIRQSGDTLLSLINDILDFSRIEANKMEIVNSEYTLHDLIRECYTFFEQTAEEKDLYIAVKCDENLPSRLSGDVRHIKQVYSNIISNAIKYTKEGGVTIDVGFRKIADANINLVFKVTDTGMGIDREDIDQLFDAFRRVNEKKNATIQGTGLGLAITKKLITLMHGKIMVDSTPGKGSCFTVMLPQKVVDNKPAGVFSKEAPKTAYEYTESFVAPDAEILAVDDVNLNLKLITALLKKTQVNIDTASGGTEAMEKCRDRKYDVILLDHRMPDPDGIETFKVITREGMNTDTPVVMLTANALSGAEKEYMEMGFSGYLSKPVKGSDLEEMLRRLLPQEKII